MEILRYNKEAGRDGERREEIRAGESHWAVKKMPLKSIINVQVQRLNDQ
jgi:hypothetical protein